MIDDNDEDEYEDEDEDQEEEEEGEVGGEEGGGPGSKALTQEPLIPSPAMEEPHKYRPTTLHLTALGAQVRAQAQAPALLPLRVEPHLSAALVNPPPQDSLNNNGGFAPAPPASWPETVLHSPLQESLRGEQGTVGGHRRPGREEGRGRAG